MSPPSVRLQGVTKRFGDFAAVSHLDLDIERGEFFTLLGPSGCGKTTTLRMIAGFEEPTEGCVLLDGDDVTGLPAFKRPTNTVFQSYALFPHLSVERNVAFGLERQKIAKDEVRRRVAEELERVGLTREAKRRPRQLSGGQQQRVALARALVNRPAVLLLDEPLGALDLKLRKQLQVELKSIQRDVGITFVYVTHDQEEALTMSDRIAVMNRGVIEQVEGPEEVYERPRTTFVAGFIGVSNLMPGEVVSANGGQAELRLDSGVTVNTESRGAATGERAHAVVRPEKLELRPLGEAPDPGQTRCGRNRGELALPGHGHAVRGAPGGLHGDDRPRARTRTSRRAAGYRVRATKFDWPGRTSTSTSCERRRARTLRRPILQTLPRPDRRRTVPRKPNTDFERRFDEMMRGELTRRRLLRQGAAGALSVSAIAYLAACGDDELSGGAKEETKAIPKGEIATALTFANWPLYIDVDDKTGERPSLQDFQKKYGTKVKYVEEVNDNIEFFGKVRQEYGNGSSGGRDVHVVTDWMAAQDEAAGLRAEVRQVRDAERHQEHRGRGGQPGLRSQARVLDAVAVGPDRR